ncbi:MAG TPA: methionine synthase [Methanocorpusculum sp.]|nr:methionine synthase [Methanocorpusculum sp.]
MNLPCLLPTTVVGSFPCIQTGGLFDPYKKAMKFAVAEQLRAGIDIISDGQVRAGMVQLFTGKLPGISGSSVVGKIGCAGSPITVADTRYALSQTKMVKGILTGPCTISYALQIETPTYRNKEEVALDLAAALHEEAKHLAHAGCTIIQIDEPILSTGAIPIDLAKRCVSVVFDGIDTPSCIHTCGVLGDITDEWTKIPVDILDFEYAVSPENLETLSRHDLHGKKIGCGCVKSSDQAVESVAEIEAHICNCIDTFGKDNILIDPDCGLRMHTPEGAYQKLTNMCAAVKTVRSEL